MKILLDTHCWLWMEAAPERLFDRMLVAQAVIEGMALLTADPQLEAYPAKVLRAR